MVTRRDQNYQSILICWVCTLCNCQRGRYAHRVIIFEPCISQRCTRMEITTWWVSASHVESKEERRSITVCKARSLASLLTHTWQDASCKSIIHESLYFIHTYIACITFLAILFRHSISAYLLDARGFITFMYSPRLSNTLCHHITRLKYMANTVNFQAYQHVTSKSLTT